MLQVVLSLNNNILKCTYITKKGEFNSHTVSVPNHLVNDNNIIDTTNFTSFLKTNLQDFLGKKYSNINIIYLLEPQDTFSTISIVPNNKDSLYDYDKLIEQVKHDLEGVDLNELYYSFDKIAPFIRHFNGIKKTQIDTLLKVFLDLNIPIKAIMPWESLLPKYINALDHSLFIIHNQDSTYFLLSEYNNIYFNKKYNVKFKNSQIETHIHELKEHKQTAKIKKVYYLGKENFDIKEDLEFIKISIPNSSDENAKGYELHLLTHFMLDFDKDIVNTNINSLNLMPLVATPKNTSIVTYAPAVVSVFLLLIGVYFASNNLNSSINNTNFTNNSEQIAGVSTTQESNQNIQEDASNISESNVESTQSTDQQVDQENDNELSKQDLTINIQNGAGIVGLAGRTKIYLQDLGYGIYDIGDANVFGLEQTRVRFKKDKLKYQDLLKSDIENRFLDIVIEDDLDEDSEYDVLLILGSNVDEEAQ